MKMFTKLMLLSALTMMMMLFTVSCGNNAAINPLSADASVTTMDTLQTGSAEYLPVSGQTISMKAVNGQYVCAAGGNTNVLMANRNSVGTYEKYIVVSAGSGQVALKCIGNSKYVTVDSVTLYLKATSTTIGTSEKFQFVSVNGNTAIKSVKTGKYVSADSLNNIKPLIANRSSVGSYENFVFNAIASIPAYQELRVVSLNTERTKVFLESARKAAFDQMFSELKPDILLLQEIAYDENFLGLTDADIQGYINRFPDIGVSKWYFKANFFSLCTISRYPIKLAQEYKNQRIYVVLIDTPGRETLTINVHFAPGANKQEQSTFITDIVTKVRAGTFSGVSKDAAIIFGGDANFKYPEQEATAYAILTSKLTDAKVSAALSFDYIMYTDNCIDLLDKSVWTKTTMSDHKPLYARFKKYN